MHAKLRREFSFSVRAVVAIPRVLIVWKCGIFCMINLSSPYVSPREYDVWSRRLTSSSSTYLLRPLFQSQVTNNAGLYISVFNRVRP